MIYRLVPDSPFWFRQTPYTSVLVSVDVLLIWIRTQPISDGWFNPGWLKIWTFELICWCSSHILIKDQTLRRFFKPFELTHNIPYSHYRGSRKPDHNLSQFLVSKQWVLLKIPKLYQLKCEQKAQDSSKLNVHIEQDGNWWGATKIRSYVFLSYSMAQDPSTNYPTGMYNCEDWDLVWRINSPTQNSLKLSSH